MDPITAGIISGGSGAASQIIGGYMTNQANSAQAQRQMDFQRDMSNTAHQREVTDLRKAGLNPILSAGGAGASTPVGAQATMTNPLAGLSDGISKGMDTAIAVRGQNKQIQSQDAGIDNTKADTANKSAQQLLLRNQSMSTKMDIEQKNMTNKVLQETLDSQIKKAKAEGDYSEINQIMGVINSGANSAGALINPFERATRPGPSMDQKNLNWILKGK